MQIRTEIFRNRMTRYISEDDLKRQKGSRELFNLQPSDALDKFSIVHQKNGTLRVSESVDDTAFFHHRCDDCKLGRALLFVQQYDSTSGLKFVGTLHAPQQHSTFEQFLPKLRGILALPDMNPSASLRTQVTRWCTACASRGRFVILSSPLETYWSWRGTSPAYS
jgi:hypothetical protein